MWSNGCSAFTLHILKRFYVILLLLFVIKIPSSSTSAQQTVEIDLVPFQILYITNSNSDVSSSAMDDMTVLSVTRTHLERIEFEEERNAEYFISLTLYQTVRTNDMFTNGTKIAFGGSALYNNSAEFDVSQQAIDHLVLFRCFLGENETAYVDALRSVGWTNLDRALVMTMNGSRVHMNSDGTDMMIDDPSNGGSDTSTMDKDMSKMIYFVSVFVPLSLIFLIGVCFVCYMLRYNVQWKQQCETDVHPIWINIHSTKRMLRRRTLDGSFSANQTNDNGSDDLTLDVPSVAPPADAVNPDRNSKLLRKNSARSTTMRITGFQPMNDEEESVDVPRNAEKNATRSKSSSRRVPSQCVEV